MSRVTQQVATPRRERNSCSIIKEILFKTMFVLRYYFDLLVDKVFGLLYDTGKQKVPSTDNPIIFESATSIASKIRHKQLKAEDVVEAFIRRIREVNPILNAVVDNRFKKALAEARDLDKAIETGAVTDDDFREKCFLGVPFTSKESTAAEGMSCTFGLFARKGRKAPEDAEIVRLVKKAGGILLGVTNIPQLNMWQETSNPLFGRTNNPYDTSRNVGGSSGGEASILAAGGSPLGLGTDIGGSLRIPAFMCGVYGHKPTCDIINTRGMTYRTGEEKNSMVVAGPMTRFAEDLIPLLKVMAGENASKLNLDKPVKVENLTVYYVDDPQDPFVSQIRGDMKSCFQNVVDYLGQVLPKKPQKVQFEGLKYGGKLWRYWMSQEPNSNFVCDVMDREGEVNPLFEIFKYLLFQRHFSLSTVFNMLNKLLPEEKAEWAIQETKKLRNQILDKLGDDGILLYPSAPWPASYHNAAFLRPWNFNLFSIWNALKLPVTQIPLGLNSEGLPLGIQAVAAPLNDRLTIALAKNLEERFGGYVAPFVLEDD